MRGRLALLVAVVGLVVGSCSPSTDSGSLLSSLAEVGTTDPSSDGEAARSTSTTTGSYIDPAGQFFSMVEQSRSGAGAILRGLGASVPGALELRIDDVLADWSSANWREGDTVTIDERSSGWPSADVLLTVGQGEPVPVLVFTMQGELAMLALLSDDLKRLERRSSGRVADGLGWGVRVAESIDEGRLVALMYGPIDPNVSVACQDLTARRVPFSVVGDDEVASLIRFGTTVLDDPGYWRETEGVPAPGEVASSVEASHQAPDPVTGESYGPYAGDIEDQLARGVPVDELELLPTVPFNINVGEMNWLRPGGEIVVFADTETGRLLGWIALAGFTGGEDLVVGVMMPPTGDVGVYLRGRDENFTCTDELPSPYMAVARGDLARKRFTLLLDEARAVVWQSTD
jgi:hypothetical protein